MKHFVSAPALYSAVSHTQLLLLLTAGCRWPLLLLRPCDYALQTLSNVASLLGVDEKSLEDMLTLKVVPVTRGEVFTKHLAVKEAVRARDAATKSLYEAIFLWVVKAINVSLGGLKVKGDDKLPFIGLLDIFGEFFFVTIWIY